MDTNKFTAIVTGLQGLIEDYKACKSLPVKIEIEEMIVDRANFLVKEYRSESIASVDIKSDDCKEEVQEAGDLLMKVVEAVDEFTSTINRLANLKNP